MLLLLLLHFGDCTCCCSLAGPLHVAEFVGGSMWIGELCKGCSSICTG
jgi:hypothetical protein